QMKERLPGQVRFSAIQNPKLWLETELDSLGNYSVSIPPGKYQITLPDAYLTNGNNVYATSQKKPITLSVKAGEKTRVPQLVILGSSAPDLIPDKGVLHDFTEASTKQVDRFIEAYQNYFSIPGVSLALIKD